ncbi:MAG TPA: hypothetical protein P5137_14535 [Candidatus Brocadiia bacterium]|nr:hypothetical protein [Candidatus Brocadiia bacterium]
MLWYLIGFALGAGALGVVWFVLRKLGARFTWRGTEWLAGLLALALAAGCAAAPKDSAPAGARASRPPSDVSALSDLSDTSDTSDKLDVFRAPAPQPGSAANPIFFRDPVLEALLARPWSTARAIAPEGAEPGEAVAKSHNPAVSSVPKPQAPEPQKPSGSLWGAYFWRRAGFDLGAVCGAAAFGAVWWFLLRRKAEAG